MIPENLDEILRILKSKGIKREAVADYMVYDRSTISAYANGKKPMSDKFLNALESKFFVNQNFIKKGIEPKFTKDVDFKKLKLDMSGDSSIPNITKKTKLTAELALLTTFLQDYSRFKASVTNADADVILSDIFSQAEKLFGAKIEIG